MTLTKYSEGSLKELGSIAFPLMVSSFSAMAMFFVDRLLLAHYSTAALNATVAATTLGWAFVFGWMVMGSIAEVFVAQYNGAGHKEKLGEPVWQMLWLSLFTFLFFIPMAIWGTEFIFGDGPDKTHERDYFSIMMLFGPSFPMYTALCSFFVGQGKTKLITILALIANFVNAVFDLVLIFGIEGWMEPMGVKGAAIATSGSGIFQVIVLFYVFLRKTNRLNFGTSHFGFKWKSFIQCVKIGSPGAVFAVIEILGWAIFYWMMTIAGERHITIAGICQSVAILFYFFAEGISKAATTVVGNLIGAKRTWFIPKVITSGLMLHSIFFVIMGVVFTFGADLLIKEFLPHASAEVIDSMHHSLLICLYFILIYLLFEGIRLLFAGVLTAAGDTIFLLISGSLSVWIFLVLPVYLFIVKWGYSVEVALSISVIYSIIASGIYFWRFKHGGWKNKSIIS